MLKLYKEMRKRDYEGIYFFICYWTFMIKCSKPFEVAKNRYQQYDIKLRMLHPLGLLLLVIMTIASPLISVWLEKTLPYILNDIWCNEEYLVLF